jgi:adenosylmethionine-8-amino-7-oxononanoate aminotransferase
MDQSHWDDAWDVDRLMQESQDHCMASWVPGAVFRNTPLMSHGEGCYLYDRKGKKYLDWTSQAVCVNLGYDVPPQVMDAVNKQLSTLPMSYGGLGNTEVRIRLAKLLSELLPGHLNGFLFPSAGSEANEAAIRIARRFTGKPKIINQYRSYHGGSPGSLQATGDFRRNFVEEAGPAPGFIKTFNPVSFGMGDTFSFGKTDEEKTANALAFLEDQIAMEGAHTIAAFMLEPIVGAGGVYVLPEGYLKGVREICDRNDMLLICDEVMVGFGRTGKFWGFQHYDVVPDIVTSAKGLSGAWMPLSMVACSDKVKECFETKPLGWGATYHAHPVAMACAYEAIKFMLQEDLVSKAKNVIEPIMKKNLNAIADSYPTIASPRAVGAFGCIDLIDGNGQPIQRFDGSKCNKPEAVMAFRKALLENGIYGLLRPPLVHCAPALVIKPEELEEGFKSFEKAIDVYDAAVRS